MKTNSIIIGAYLLLTLFFSHLTPPTAARIHDAETYIQTSHLPNIYSAPNLFIDKGYPIFINLIQSITGYENIRALQFSNYILWGLSAYLIYLSLQLYKSSYAKIGSVLMLFSPLYLSFSPKVYSEPLAAFSVSLGIYALNLIYYKNSLVSHILLALAVLALILTKSVFIPLIFILIVVLLVIKRPIPIIWVIASLILSVPGIFSSIGGGRSLYNLAIQSSKLSNSTTEIVSCLPYYISYPLGYLLAPKYNNICRHNDPDPNLPGYDRNSYVIANEKRNNSYSYQQWLKEISRSPFKYLLVMLVSMGNIILIEGIYPSVLLQLPVIIQIIFFIYKIFLSILLWYMATKKKTPWILIPLTYFFLVIGNFPVEARYFYPLIPLLYFSAFLDPQNRMTNKVVHVATWQSGGAGIMARRISESLNKSKIESTIYSAENQGKILYIWTRISSYFDAFLNKVYPISNPIFRSFNLFPTFHPRLHFDEAIKLIHIHWMGAGFINLFELLLIKKPIIWTLHDLWAVLGSEHMPDIDKKKSHEKRLIDLLILKVKKYVFNNLQIHFVAPSSYMYDYFAKSSIGHNQSISIIPNGINISRYPKKKYINKKSRSIFFAAMNAKVDKNKGLDLLQQALWKIKKRRVATTLRIAGTTSLEGYNFPDWIKVECLGSLKSSEMYHEYAMADLTVVPSRLESFSLVTLESMTVGTPVIAFKVGGIVDLIDHKTNGYLANPYSTKDFARGIDYLLDSPSRVKMFGDSARIKAKKFDLKKVAKAYQKLYLQALSVRVPNSIPTQVSVNS